MTADGQKVLITGASGFIGRRLRSALLDGGADVVAIRRPGSPAAKEGRTAEASYDDLDRLKAIVAEERPDLVLHVAGVTKGRTYEDFARGNVVPTANLLRALEEEHRDVGRFVHVSSLAAYGPAKPGEPLTEDHSRRPIEHYGTSKLEAEHAVEDAEVPWTIVRPAGVYGPGDVDYFELFKAATRRVNLFFGNKERWFSAIYVDDCVSAILQAAEHPETAGQDYFLTDDQPTTWERFQQKICEAVGKRTLSVDLGDKLVSLAAHAGELATRIDGKPRIMNRQKALMGFQDAWLCSGAKAKEHFDFECEVDHHEGVHRTHRWYHENDWY
jgi:nucleoside-diphosphate-sugar epimerase